MAHLESLASPFGQAETGLASEENPLYHLEGVQVNMPLIIEVVDT